MARRAYGTDSAPTTVTVGQLIYVVSVSHRYGGDAWACASEEGARRSVADYCRAWWGDPHGEWDTVADEDGAEVPVEAPEDDEACITAYFTVMDDEGYDVSETILNS